MIKFFEKHNKLSLVITFIIAIMIFYISSLSFFKPAGKVAFDIKPILYHMLAFFFFSYFLLISLIQGKNKNLSVMIMIAIIISLFYGVSDEIHQLFVPGRTCSFFDFLLDSSGILFAGFLYTLSIKPRKNKNEEF